MAEYAPRCVAQIKPDAGVLTDGYVAPLGTHAKITSVLCCNVGAGTDTFRLSLALQGAGNSLKQYLYYDHDLALGQTYPHEKEINLAPGDVLRVYSGNGDVSFNIFGLEQR